MKIIHGHLRSILLTAIAAAVLAAPVMAEGINDFTLTKAIPADSFMAAHSRSHEGMAFLQKQSERIWEEIKAARFDKDIKRFFKAVQSEGLPPGTEPEGFEEWWQQMYDLATAVDWASLGEREFAMGMKLGFPTPEFVMLFMPPKDKLKENFEGLSGVVKTIASFNPELIEISTQEDAGDVIHSISLKGAPFAFIFTIANHEDVILIGFGTTMVEQSLALLRGQPGESFASTQRFQEAFKQLPPPADAFSFVDMAKMFKQVRQVIDQLITTVTAMQDAPAFESESQIEMEETEETEAGEPQHKQDSRMSMTDSAFPQDAQEEEETPAQTGAAQSAPEMDQEAAMKMWMALPGKILDEMDVIDYIAEVAVTNDKLTTTDTLAVLRADAKDRALYKIITNNKPLMDPLKYIPKEANDFSVASGVDLKVVWQLIVKLLKNDVPEGAEALAEIENLKTETGWDIEKDVFGWIGGGFQSFSIPGPMAYSSPEFVFMLSVTDEAKAKEILDRLLAMLQPMLASQNGSIIDAEIEGAEGFKAINYPMLAMMGGMTKPVIGVKDGWLFFGSSPKIITTTLSVAAGLAENISKNERFQKEGLLPKGSVTSLSFKDLTQFGEQVGSILQMIPMFGQMVPDIAKDPKMSVLMSVVSKVGKVVRKLDFFQSSAACTTFDGKAFRTKALMTYREPPPPPQKPVPPTTPATEEGAGGEKPAGETK